MAYVAGSFAGESVSVGFGIESLSNAGGEDSYLLKVDPAGTPVWFNRIGGAGEDVIHAVALAQGAPVVAGSLHGAVDLGDGLLTSQGTDALLVKYNSDGVLQWRRAYGDNLDQSANALSADSLGNLYLGGTLAGTMDFGGGKTVTGSALDTTDGFIAKLDSSGVGIWAMGIGQAGANESVTGVALYGFATHVIGSYDGALTIGGAPLAAPPTGGAGAFVSKLNSAGTYAWSKGFVSSLTNGQVVARAVTVNKDNVVAVVGWAQGQVDFGGGARTCSQTTSSKGAFVVLLSSSGAHTYSTCFAGLGGVEASGVAHDTAGWLVAGSFSGKVDFGGGMISSAALAESAYLLRLGPAGSFKGQGIYESGKGAWVSPYSLNEVLFAGTFKGTIEFGATTLTAMGSRDVFLARVSAP